MVRMPSSSSRVSAFTASTNHCILLMYGTPRHIMNIIQARRITIATAVTAVHSKALDAILHTAHTARIGALMTMLMARPKNCCIW